MPDPKNENLLNLALDTPEAERERSLELNVGYDVAEKAVNRAYMMYDAYVKNKTKRAKYLPGVLKKSNGKDDFDCLFFMTPAAYAATGLTSKSEAFTYKGQTFFTYWK